MNIICTLLKNYTAGWLVGVYRPFSQKYGYIRDESKTIQRQRQHTDQRAKSMLNESALTENKALVLSFHIVVRLPKNRVVVLQFRLTSKSLPHFKCHVISLVDVIGFNMYNRCDSHTDNRTKHIMFNSCDTGRCHCRMTAAAAVATDRRDDRIL